MTSYADLVLAAIPIGFAGLAAPLVILGVNGAVAVPVGAVVALAVMTHAFFVRPPGDGIDSVEPANHVH